MIFEISNFKSETIFNYFFPFLVPCKAGYYSATGLEVCTKCKKGTYQPETKRSVCKECPGGVYGGIEGATNISECPSKLSL